ncbi:hypothetical protein, partial [Pseudomonas syringae group genomosp. 7]|uniref:hypothetical protein n=1 Tax=Pseudomonas syringae group genomosp. 7 TaxID=251699 RepID=UPI0037704B96
CGLVCWVWCFCWCWGLFLLCLFCVWCWGWGGGWWWGGWGWSVRWWGVWGWCLGCWVGGSLLGWWCVGLGVLCGGLVVVWLGWVVSVVVGFSWVGGRWGVARCVWMGMRLGQAVL